MTSPFTSKRIDYYLLLFIFSEGLFKFLSKNCPLLYSPFIGADGMFE
jgi:hypothetical protein